MINTWTSSAHRGPARFGAWRDALSQSHLEWSLDPQPEQPFAASIVQRTLDGVRIVDCRCDPCTGWRRRPELMRTDGAFFGVLFELGGREVIRQGDREATLKAGDFVLWDSEREMEFKVLKPLHKLTLLIPKSRMQMLLGNAERYAGNVIPSSGKADGISAEALRRLARDFATIDDEDASTVIEPLLCLLSATLMARCPSTTISAGHKDSFRRFCQHIEKNLGDAALAPSTVAKEHGVSLRYLHLVFSEQGTTFSRYVKQSRLARCYQELSHPKTDNTVTQIAFRWGFNDMAHFSRVFKAEFEVPPKDVRAASR